MELIIDHDSPLAQYLEGSLQPLHRAVMLPSPSLTLSSGQGRRSSMSSASCHSMSPPHPQSFAPSGPSVLQKKLRDRLPQPLRIPASSDGSLGRLQVAYSRAVNVNLGRADNQRFLEHFRYLIVASHLLSDHPGPSAVRPSATCTSSIDDRFRIHDFRANTVSLTGAVWTGIAAFTLVWLLHWSRSKASGFGRGRIAVFCITLLLVAIISYGYVRRQRLLLLRQQAVEGASLLVTNLQAFEASTSSALSLIQEVELVSRGYRLSPLPPITRLEERGQSRRCDRLRRSLGSIYAEAMPTFHTHCEALKNLVHGDDLDKYLDIYDVARADLQDAAQGYSKSEFDDVDALKALRVLQHRLFTLRRALLCALLALEVEGDQTDLPRWGTAVDAARHLAKLTGDWSERINRILREEEQFSVPSPATVAPNPARDRLRASVRKLSSLSQGIRGLQAKMQILREESHQGLEEAEDVTEIGSHLMSQYESIGVDLKSLVQAWEAGRNALALNIGRHERRVSQASSGLWSPVPSLGGLTAVEEGSPSDALRALNGDTASPRGSSSSSDEASHLDEEIFEGMAIPRQRPLATREARMKKSQADCVRQDTVKEQREASNNMLKELESVISRRPQKNSGAWNRSRAASRVTSL